VSEAEPCRDGERPLRAVPDAAEEPGDAPRREVAVRDETAPARRDEPLEGTVLPWRQEVRPRPVFAAWIVDRDELSHAGRWLVIYVGHTSAFHAVRIPAYVGRTLMYAPRGAGRAIWLWWQWVTDAEGQPLRLHARDKNATSDYVTLVRLRDQRVRPRAIGSAIVAVVAAVAVPVTSLWWPWEPYALAAAAVAVLGYVGRRLDRPFFAPAVLTSPEAPRLTGEIVVRALASLGIPAIREAMKTPPGITFASECHRDGPGWRADVDLPYGVTAGMIMDKRLELASGLRRQIGCVWPEADPDAHAGRLVLWVGDQDFAKARQKPWPLLKTGRANVFEPVPYGYDQRGRLIRVPLMFENVLIGAIPRQGKTFALRVLALACALDPIVETRVFELKGTGDLSCMEKVAHHYGSGADDDTIYACLTSLRELHKDLERRSKVIRGLPKDMVPENKVTPDLAAKKTMRLHPVAFILDEAQELFSHPEYGQEAEALCVPLIKRGPAMGVFLLIATQRPDKNSLPTGVSANVSVRLCLRVMGQIENDMILGTSSYKNGLRATTFTKRDKGVGYLVGAEDDALIVRSCYIDNPTADKVADRARVLRKQAGTLTGYAIGEEQDTGPAVSLVEDVASILQPGEERLWCQTAVARLAELRPGMYAEWTAGQLTEALKPYGVSTRDTWGRDADGEDRNRKGFLAKDVHDAVSKITREPR
jgi:DNA segregation ATPase FtsK/SpoIIIE, S-DNA-T family